MGGTCHCGGGTVAQQGRYRAGRPAAEPVFGLAAAQVGRDLTAHVAAYVHTRGMHGNFAAVEAWLTRSLQVLRAPMSCWRVLTQHLLHCSDPGRQTETLE